MKEELRIAVEDLGSANSNNSSLEDEYAKKEKENLSLTEDVLRLSDEVEKRKRCEEVLDASLEEAKEELSRFSTVKLFKIILEFLGFKFRLSSLIYFVFL